MKNKKSIAVILVVVCLLVCGVLLWRGLSHKDNTHQEGGVIDGVAILPSDPGGDAQPGQQPVDETEPGEDQQQEDGNTEPTIKEDGGDLIIVIPDDQESGGL